MYNLQYFKEESKETVLEFMQQHPFVFLTGCGEKNLPIATQVPVFVDERDGKLFITGHIMRNTDHHKGFLKNSNVLVVFSGPHCYVSASWYSNPHQASTWNYMSVHAKGDIQFLDDQALIDVLKRLSLKYENNNSTSPTVFENLPDKYKFSMLNAIVAFEIEVSAIDNVFKLSQNRDEKSYQSIIENLKHQEGDKKLIAEEMEKRQQQLFGV